MKDRITVHLDEKPVYDIVLENSFDRFSQELSKFNLSKRKVCIVTDTNVAMLYLSELTNLISTMSACVISFSFLAGEQSKNLNTVNALYETLIHAKFDRGDWLIALGGGVVGDLCGFAAATYLRGISFVQVPTTLLSQSDSSIGGKTGVDFDSYKNMVGAFYMPKLVYINISTLKTLSDSQYYSGMGEVIKHGLIKDASFYQWLMDHKLEINQRQLDICKEMVTANCHIKCNVVEQDPTEQGDRALLNFGHTLGHGIEKAMKFEKLHGECVAIGALAAVYLSAKRGNIAFEEVDRLRDLLTFFHLPAAIANIDRKLVMEAVKHDKKMDSGIIKFILLKHIGNAYIDRSVTSEELSEAIEYIKN